MVIIETTLFERIRERYLADHQYALLGWFLSQHPDSSDIIRGSGGVRKLRWRGARRGKRGGLRVIYYWNSGKNQVVMLTVYAKAEVNDLTPAQIKALRKMTKAPERS